MFMQPPVQVFPSSHFPPRSNPFQRQGRLPPQLCRPTQFHRIALPPPGQIIFPPACFGKSGLEDPFGLLFVALLALRPGVVLAPLSLHPIQQFLAKRLLTPALIRPTATFSHPMGEGIYFGG
jgi:hypothetical protein